MRTKAALVQQAGGKHRAMLEIAHPVHSAYCKKHEIDYFVFGEPTHCLDGRHPVWEKVGLLRGLAREGNDPHALYTQAPYEHIIWLDSDCLIVDHDADLRDGCPPGPAGGIGLTRHEMDWGRLAPAAYDHFNCGAMYLTNSEKVRAFLDAWWSWPAHDHQWREQHSLNEMTALYPGLVLEIAARWNSTTPYFEANNEQNEVVRAWHGLFQEEERKVCLLSAVADWQSGGRGHEDGYWKARIRSEAQFRELVYDMRKRERKRVVSEQPI